MKKFADLRDGGRALAPALQSYAGRDDVVVLAIVRGGVPVAAEVAKHLGVAYDILHFQRLLMPHGPGSAICASYVAGTLVVDEELARHRGDAGFELYLQETFERIARRDALVRGTRVPLELAGKTVLLVDNAIRTGSTLRIAISAVRRMSPARVVAAVPVGAPESRAGIEAIADELIVLGWPAPFGNAGMWYEKFDVPVDEVVAGFRA
ncbi:MAG TPA: phosphoribosyltransferase family protein [Thermoanaerobaculia bacterium]|nr:phosphoribosyltransferase family protein [Thermoanaerobaculia bacterium]